MWEEKQRHKNCKGNMGKVKVVVLKREEKQ